MKVISFGMGSYCNISLLHMIVNVDNIDGNEKAIARKENVKVTYIQD